jgi:hypothetical protein
MPLVSLENLKDELGIAREDNTQDVLLQAIVTAVLSVWDNMTNRTWESGSKTEYYDCSAHTTKIFLRNWPVTSVTTIHDDPDWAWAADSLIPTADYQTDTEKGIIHYMGEFYTGSQNVKVVYTAGYSAVTVPAWWKQLIVRQAAHWSRQAIKGISDVSSKVVGSNSTNYKDLENNLLPDFMLFVNMERRML